MKSSQQISLEKLQALGGAKESFEHNVNSMDLS